MKIIEKSNKFTVNILNEKIDYTTGEYFTAELILYELEDGKYKFELVGNIPIQSSISRRSEDISNAVNDLLLGIVKKLGVFSTKAVIRALTGCYDEFTYRHAGREIGSDDLKLAWKKYKDAKQVDYEKVVLFSFCKSSIGKTTFVQPYIEGPSRDGNYFWLYSKNLKKCFQIGIFSHPDFKKWLILFGLQNKQNESEYDFWHDIFHQYYGRIFQKENVLNEVKNTCIVQVINTEESDILREYAIRIDEEQVYYLEKNIPFELNISAGHHKIEIANKTVISQDTDWVESNRIASGKYFFEPGNMLLFMINSNECDTKWL